MDKLVLLAVPDWDDSYFELRGRVYVQLDADLHWVSACDAGASLEAGDDSPEGAALALLDSGAGTGLHERALVRAYVRALLASGLLTDRKRQLVERLACDWDTGTIELWDTITFLTGEN
jgi:hypothetical protein